MSSPKCLQKFNQTNFLQFHVPDINCTYLLVMPILTETNFDSFQEDFQEDF